MNWLKEHGEDPLYRQNNPDQDEQRNAIQSCAGGGPTPLSCPLFLDFINDLVGIETLARLAIKISTRSSNGKDSRSGEIFGNGKDSRNEEIFGNGKDSRNGEIFGNGKESRNGEIFGNGKDSRNGEIFGNGKDSRFGRFSTARSLVTGR
ncbi:variant surface antigen B-like [Aplysia californica]|uniref:Variant surface antigen B-like n=1 Tax=Aplysia californica TaxID=6500 RepID=A0ABM1W3U4_APLCA|nr:variant surface antigen B-like [Aplysia californica]